MMPPKRKAANASIGYSSRDGVAANKRSAKASGVNKEGKHDAGRKNSSEPPGQAEAEGDEDILGPAPGPGVIHGDAGVGDSEAGVGTKPEEEYQIVQRRFYPPEMSNERCAQFNNNEIPRPMEELETAIKDTTAARQKITAGDAVLHWFKRDLRLGDNKGLSLAAAKAKEANIPLIALFIVSPQDYEAHLTAPSRVDFELRTLEIMKQDLAELDIPLVVQTIEKRKEVPSWTVSKCKEWGINHIYTNVEYEVDELRREAKMTRLCADKGIDFMAVHDDAVVVPGELKTGQGKQYAVYSPWYRAWVAHIYAHPHILDEHPRPTKNPPAVRASALAPLFNQPIPSAPPNKALSEEERTRFTHLWPAGEHEALSRLHKFLHGKIGKYQEMRNFPTANNTSVLSVHHSAGTLAARTSVRSARDVNSARKLDRGMEGVKGWIGEVAWRDFYKHVLVHWPYVCMHKPFKYEYTNVEWEYNNEHFRAWCEGRTGYPIVDAAMRHLAHHHYLHNRLRMVTASFLSKHLLLDWRLGERYFMLHLIDGDFASNNGGWGFSASVGVDPQSYFRIFNPLLQSERFDESGEFIKRWVKELEGAEGKAVHDPYGRGAGDMARRNGYPERIVDQKLARERALAKYKAGVGRNTA